jgi:hypothetical protein
VKDHCLLPCKSISTCPPKGPPNVVWGRRRQKSRLVAPHPPQTDFHSAWGVFFVRCTRSKPSAPGDEQGHRLRPKTPWAIPVSETLPFSPKSAIASRTPTRLPPRCLVAPFPDGAPSFHQTPYRPVRQLFKVVRRIAGLSRSTSNLDLAQEVFSVLPRPWTSSWTPTTRPCSPL